MKYKWSKIFFGLWYGNTIQQWENIGTLTFFHKKYIFIDLNLNMISDLYTSKET